MYKDVFNNKWPIHKQPCHLTYHRANLKNLVDFKFFRSMAEELKDFSPRQCWLPLKMTSK